MPIDPTTPTTTDDFGRKADLQDAIIEAVHKQDGVGGIKAFAAYDDFIEAQARADERRRLAGLVEGLPGIVLSSSSGTDGHLSWGIYRAAVLAVFDTKPAP